MSKPLPESVDWGDLSEERATRRLWTALVLSPRIEICEALLAGVAVPVHRLDQCWVTELDLSGVVVLTEELVLRVNAHGPLDERRAE